MQHTHPPQSTAITLAATAVNAVILADEHGTTLTLEPQLALTLAHDLARQALQTLQLSQTALSSRQARRLTTQFRELSEQIHAAGQTKDAQLEDFLSKLVFSSGVPHVPRTRQTRKNAHRPAAE